MRIPAAYMLNWSRRSLYRILENLPSSRKTCSYTEISRFYYNDVMSYSHSLHPKNVFFAYNTHITLSEEVATACLCALPLLANIFFLLVCQVIFWHLTLIENFIRVYI